MVRYLSEQLNSSGLSELTDVIILSDHGMGYYYFNSEEVDESIIDLYRIVGKYSCDVYGSSPVLQLIARPGYDQTELCNKLKRAAAINGNFSVYTSADLNELKPHWHVQNDRRFAPCIAVAELGHAFQDVRKKLRKRPDYERCTYGCELWTNL